MPPDRQASRRRETDPGIPSAAPDSSPHSKRARPRITSVNEAAADVPLTRASPVPSSSRQPARLRTPINPIPEEQPTQHGQRVFTPTSTSPYTPSNTRPRPRTSTMPSVRGSARKQSAKRKIERLSETVDEFIEEVVASAVEELDEHTQNQVERSWQALYANAHAVVLQEDVSIFTPTQNIIDNLPEAFLHDVDIDDLADALDGFALAAFAWIVFRPDAAGNLWKGKGKMLDDRNERAAIHHRNSVLYRAWKVFWTVLPDLDPDETSLTYWLDMATIIYESYCRPTIEPSSAPNGKLPIPQDFVQMFKNSDLSGANKSRWEKMLKTRKKELDQQRNTPFLPYAAFRRDMLDFIHSYTFETEEGDGNRPLIRKVAMSAEHAHAEENGMREPQRQHDRSSPIAADEAGDPAQAFDMSQLFDIDMFAAVAAELQDDEDLATGADVSDDDEDSFGELPTESQLNPNDGLDDDASDMSTPTSSAPDQDYDDDSQAALGESVLPSETQLDARRYADPSSDYEDPPSPSSRGHTDMPPSDSQFISQGENDDDNDPRVDIPPSDSQFYPAGDSDDSPEQFALPSESQFAPRDDDSEDEDEIDADIDEEEDSAEEGNALDIRERLFAPRGSSAENKDNDDEDNANDDEDNADMNDEEGNALPPVSQLQPTDEYEDDEDEDDEDHSDDSQDSDEDSGENTDQSDDYDLSELSSEGGGSLGRLSSRYAGLKLVIPVKVERESVPPESERESVQPEPEPHLEVPDVTDEDWEDVPLPDNALPSESQLHPEAEDQRADVPEDDDDERPDPVEDFDDDATPPPPELDLLSSATPKQAQLQSSRANASSRDNLAGPSRAAPACNATQTPTRPRKSWTQSRRPDAEFATPSPDPDGHDEPAVTTQTASMRITGPRLEDVVRTTHEPHRRDASPNVLWPTSSPQRSATPSQNILVSIDLHSPLAQQLLDLDLSALNAEPAQNIANALGGVTPPPLSPPPVLLRSRRKNQKGKQRAREDAYVVDEHGLDLIEDPFMVVPHKYRRPKSTVFGRPDGKGSRYQRLSGRLPWTPEEALFLYRAIQQVPMSETNPCTTVDYFYGEFGKRSKLLQFFSAQHMKDKMRTIVTTRLRNNLPVTGRARHFLPGGHPDKDAYRRDVRRHAMAEETDHRTRMNTQLAQARAEREHTPDADTGDEVDDARSDGDDDEYEPTYAEGADESGYQPPGRRQRAAPPRTLRERVTDCDRSRNGPTWKASQPTPRERSGSCTPRASRPATGQSTSPLVVELPAKRPVSDNAARHSPVPAGAGPSRQQPAPVTNTRVSRTDSKGHRRRLSHGVLALTSRTVPARPLNELDLSNTEGAKLSDFLILPYKVTHPPTREEELSSEEDELDSDQESEEGQEEMPPPRDPRDRVVVELPAPRKRVSHNISATGEAPAVAADDGPEDRDRAQDRESAADTHTTAHKANTASTSERRGTSARPDPEVAPSDDEFVPPGTPAPRALPVRGSRAERAASDLPVSHMRSSVKATSSRAVATQPVRRSTRASSAAATTAQAPSSALRRSSQKLDRREPQYEDEDEVEDEDWDADADADEDAARTGPRASASDSEDSVPLAKRARPPKASGNGGPRGSQGGKKRRSAHFLRRSASESEADIPLAVERASGRYRGGKGGGTGESPRRSTSDDDTDAEVRLMKRARLARYSGGTGGNHSARGMASGNGGSGRGTTREGTKVVGNDPIPEEEEVDDKTDIDMDVDDAPAVKGEEGASEEEENGTDNEDGDEGEDEDEGGSVVDALAIGAETLAMTDSQFVRRQQIRDKVLRSQG